MSIRWELENWTTTQKLVLVYHAPSVTDVDTGTLVVLFVLLGLSFRAARSPAGTWSPTFVCMPYQRCLNHRPHGQV